MVNLTHEASLLQKIEKLAANGKIQSSVGLTKQAAKSKIEQLIPTTRQRINAAKFYLDALGNMNYAPYLRGQSSLSAGQKSLIDFSNSDLQVQINLLNSDTFPLVVFVVLNGFFSNLVSLEDCVAKTINVVYDLFQDDRFGYKIRRKLENKIPNGLLTRHLRNFHLVSRSGNPDQIGFSFNIAKQIRNQLTHDQIEDVIDFPRQFTLSGSPPDSNLYLKSSFFPNNFPREDTKMIAFCPRVFEETISFIDECYRLIERKLQHRGALPV